MKKNAFLIAVIFILIIISSTSSFCDVVKTTIIGTTDDKLYVATGENIVINAGKNYGITKGDILSIYKKDEKPAMVNEISRCVIIKTEENISICNIIKSRIEAGKGDYVFLKRLEYADSQLYPMIYTTLNELLAPYEDYREIRIYVHDIYDEKNNVTEFSRLIKEEILNIFKQKKRLLVDTVTLKEYMNFQDHYFYSDIDRSKQENIYALKKKMEQFNIDAIITGYYKVKNDDIMVKLFLVDKNQEDKSIKIFTNQKDYSNKIAEIIKPYKPFKEKEFVDYKFILNIKDYLPDRDEQREIIRLESDKEMSFRFKFAETKNKFNRISPSDINIKINDVMISDIQRGDVYEKLFEKGRKRVLVSFIPTLYDNELEVISLKKEIKKEILLDLNDEKDIFIEVLLDATYGKELAEIKVFKKKIDEKIKVKPVEIIKEKLPSIELYRD
ncbi:MAG TPA: hypothetical protein PKW07_12170 [Syntrophorhabdaceae bacterium]|nr:hypothetical protein [Syntrophorhabdaceae bacterium]